MVCKEHGKKVRLERGKIYCLFCNQEIPLDKLKK